MSMPLYDVPRYSRVRIDGGILEFEFDHIDGMYSYCTDDERNVVHLPAWTPVEIVREGPAKSVAKRIKVESDEH
jgi:hypothetical protein